MKKLFPSVVSFFILTLSVICLNNISMSQGNEITVMILKPDNGSYYSIGEVVEFSGKGIASDGYEIKDLSLEWISDKDGEFGRGDVVFSDLSSGFHVISLIIKDSAGNIFEDIINITIRN